MKVITPSFEILHMDNGAEMLKRIERAGRTCYKSEEKITDDSAEAFVRMLIKKGHESVLEHEKITVLFVCDRGVSHELVRHRIASFSQESTRYCNYSNNKFGNELTFILPPWLVDEQEFEVTAKEVYLAALERAEKDYLELIQLGWQPQQARSVLPNSLKTEVVVTANLREWRTIFRQRTSAAAHPQMRELMCPLLSELTQKVPAVFSDIQPL